MNFDISISISKPVKEIIVDDVTNSEQTPSFSEIYRIPQKKRKRKIHKFKEIQETSMTLKSL